VRSWQQEHAHGAQGQQESICCAELLVTCGCICFLAAKPAFCMCCGKRLQPRQSIQNCPPDSSTGKAILAICTQLAHSNWLTPLVQLSLRHFHLPQAIQLTGSKIPQLVLHFDPSNTSNTLGYALLQGQPGRALRPTTCSAACWPRTRRLSTARRHQALQLLLWPAPGPSWPAPP
jgi:hypothetical protein